MFNTPNYSRIQYDPSLFSGTPGTGKSTLCQELAERCGMNYINIGDVAKEGELYEGWDDQYQCPILNEDRVSSQLGSTQTSLFNPSNAEATSV